jgi:hypothetical protein
VKAGCRRAASTSDRNSSGSCDLKWGIERINRRSLSRFGLLRLLEMQLTSQPLDMTLRAVDVTLLYRSRIGELEDE